ncbi:MAG: hypothetical protein ACFE8B_05395 [Candidatus Hermodarchaeota archaeon]
MKIKKHISVVLILFILINIYISISIIPPKDFSVIDTNKDNNNQFFAPKVSNGPPLPYFAIEQNATTIYRLFEAVNFTIDTFGYSDVDYTTIQIEFSNGSTQNYNMTSISANEYSYIFQPKYNAPLGFQNVSFLIYNVTNKLLNAHTTYTNFTIKTNYMLTTNSAEYYIGNELYAELTVNDFDSYQFGWNVTIVNSTIESQQSNITNFEYNCVQFKYNIDNETFHSFIDQTFYIKLNMTDLISGKKCAAYFPFDVLNSIPVIDITSVTFSPTTVLRAEDCEISLNITDVEDLPQNLDVSMDIESPIGSLIATLDFNHLMENNFSRIFSIPANRPVGKYKITITAEDQAGGIESYITSLIVTNNLPEIHSYKINGRSADQGVSVSYGKNLVFTFNVSDVEGVAYVKVALLDQNNEWYNMTTDYKGIDTKITIRTVELITGVWYAYIYVIDHDGAITSLIDDYDMAPQAITIIPDALSGILPWIIFFVGLIIGILAGIGIASRRYKLKISESKTTTPKKKKFTPKRIFKRNEEKEKQPEDLVVKEELENEIPETEEESIPRRKIKRKL